MVLFIFFIIAGLVLITNSLLRPNNIYNNLKVKSLINLTGNIGKIIIRVIFLVLGLIFLISGIMGILN